MSEQDRPMPNDHDDDEAEIAAPPPPDEAVGQDPETPSQVDPRRE